MYRKHICPAMGLNRFHAHFEHLGREDVVEEQTDAKHGRKNGYKKVLSLSRCFRGFGHYLGYGILTFLFQTFPFPQGSAFRPSLEYTGELIDAGLCILIFPEGRVSGDGSMGTFKGGISLIAEKTGVPVIPVRISGMHDVLPPKHWLPHRGKVFVTFGKPHLYSDEGHERFTRILQDTVRSMEETSIAAQRQTRH
jgi:hypothetical protein